MAKKYSSPAQKLRYKMLSAIEKLHRFLAFTPSDSIYKHADVESPQLVGHSDFLSYVIREGNQKGKRVLEIGSREVTGPSKTRALFDKAEYVGLDYYDGQNVDVVGDAHKLSNYFDEKFDLIYSSAVFEHLAMPWLVAEEIAKVLKVGGVLAIETHFSFSSHERPWHFFHYTDMALKALFSPALGFECLDSGLSNPLVARFSTQAAPYLRNRRVTGLYCHSEYLGKKVRDVPDFSWNTADVNQVVAETKYPAPKS